MASFGVFIGGLEEARLLVSRFMADINLQPW